MNYIRLVQPADPSNYLPYPSESTPYLINAHIGTHVTQRHVAPLVYRLGPTFLFDEPMAASSVKSMYKLGPSYYGSLQAPIIDYSVRWRAAWQSVCVLLCVFHMNSLRLCTSFSSF